MVCKRPNRFSKHMDHQNLPVPMLSGDWIQVAHPSFAASARRAEDEHSPAGARARAQ